MSYESKFVQVHGVRLHYLEWESDGRPVVIVHGNSHSGGVFAPLAERLATPDACGKRGFHVFTLDLRGHGLSDQPASYTWAEFRDEVSGFIEAIDLHDVLLVAHSRGGGVCLLAAASSPERVRGVIAYEPTLPGTPSLQSRLGEIVQRTLNRRSSWASRQEMYDHFRNRGAFKDWQDEFLWAYVEHGAVATEDGRIELANPLAVEALMYETMLQDHEWQKAGISQLPVLAVYGERNARLREGFEPMDTLRHYFPRAAMSIQTNSTHSGIMEHPEAFAASVRQFAAGL